MEHTTWNKNLTARITPLMACRCCGVLLLRPITILRLMQIESAIGKKLTVTNAYRCPTHNAAVGGHPASRHMDGLAVDVVDPKIADFEAHARELFGGVLQYKNKNIWHLQIPLPREA